MENRLNKFKKRLAREILIVSISILSLFVIYTSLVFRDYLMKNNVDNLKSELITLNKKIKSYNELEKFFYDCRDGTVNKYRSKKEIEQFEFLGFDKEVPQYPLGELNDLYFNEFIEKIQNENYSKNLYLEIDKCRGYGYFDLPYIQEKDYKSLVSRARKIYQDNKKVRQKIDFTELKINRRTYNYQVKYEKWKLIKIIGLIFISLYFLRIVIKSIKWSLFELGKND